MQNGKGAAFITLNQGEARARNIQFAVAGEMANQGARGRGLADTEAAGQGDEIAGADQEREVGHQVRGVLLVGERERRHERRGAHCAALRCAD